MNTIEEYKKQLKDETYDYDFLNEKTLSSSYNYREFDVKVVSHKEDFKASIRFKTEYEMITLNSDLIPINNGKSFAHKGLPLWDDGKFVSDGYKHPFYKDVEDMFLDAIIIDRSIKREECLVGLLNNWKNDWKPEDFGLMVMFVKDGVMKGFVKYNSFQHIFDLTIKDKELRYNTKSKKILTNHQ